MKIEFSRQIFEKYESIKCHENQLNGSRAVAAGWMHRQTDRQTDERTDKRKDRMTDRGTDRQTDNTQEKTGRRTDRHKTQSHFSQFCERA